MPASLVAWMNTISDNPLVILLLLNVLMLLLGTFMDMGPTIIICTPIFLPVAQAYGIDPVHFGVIMILNFGIGLNTPPVGAVQFVACAVGKIIGLGSDALDLAVLWRRPRGARPGHLHSGDLAVAAERVQIGSDMAADRRPISGSSAGRSFRSASCRRSARRCSAARFAPGQKLPTESQLTETFGVSRTVIREAIATLAADGLVEARQGAGVFVMDHPDAGLRLDQPGDRQQDLACAQRARSAHGHRDRKRRACGAAPQQRPGSARSRRPSSSSSGCCDSAQATGKADFAFHRAIAAATNNPFYVEVLDALGTRTIPCDVTSPWGTDSVLTREYQEGLQREHLAHPERHLRRRSRRGARRHARASVAPASSATARG